jgi:predicted TIM-barrel fold metal-dependent hydrolase
MEGDVNAITAEQQRNMNIYGVPKEMKRLIGRISDIDSHEMLPVQEWIKVFGEAIRPMAEYYIEHGESEADDKNTVNIPDYPGDITEIGENVLSIKGSRAPGAVDIARRVGVMDAMGIQRQLMFPSNPSVYASFLYRYADNPNMLTFAKGSADERRAMGKRVIEMHNEALASMATISDRVRPVPLLFGDTPEEIFQKAKAFVKTGVRALWMFPSGELPGGTSPAHTDFDPLYSFLEESDTTLVLHIAGEGNFLRTESWDKAPHFEGHIRHVEFSRSPWFTAKMHLEVENFLTIMLMGGVFDRHPRLRFGLIETTAYWLGPLARRLDMWWNLDKGIINSPRPGQVIPYRLPEPPSFYLNRNVRVTPFFFEDMAHDIEHFPDLQDCYCYSSDYPHVEGGKGSVQIHFDKIKHLGDEIIDKYFVTNGGWLLPD